RPRGASPEARGGRRSLDWETTRDRSCSCDKLATSGDWGSQPPHSSNPEFKRQYSDGLLEPEGWAYQRVARHSITGLALRLRKKIATRATRIRKSRAPGVRPGDLPSLGWASRPRYEPVHLDARGMRAMRVTPGGSLSQSRTSREVFGGPSRARSP